jgi:hypothetical protein
VKLLLTLAFNGATTHDQKEVSMNSISRSHMKNGFLSAFLFAGALVFGTSAAPVLGQITVDNKADGIYGQYYPEIISQYQTGAGDKLKMVSLVTTLDTGAECILLQEGPFNKIKNGDPTTATVQIGSFAAFTDAFKKANPKVNDSQEIAKADYNAAGLTEAKQNKLAESKQMDAVGMAFLTVPGANGKTFVTDRSKSAPPEVTGYGTAYNVALFKAGDEKIPGSTVNVPASLTAFGNCPPGSDTAGVPLVKGVVEQSGKTFATQKGILVDSGSRRTVITPDFAQKITGAKEKPKVGDEITLDALTLGEGKDAAVAKNVKVVVNSRNADKREMCVGENVLQNFVTVWKLADAKPAIGFSLTKGGGGAPELSSSGLLGAPAGPYRDRQFITPGTPSVLGRNEEQTSFEDVVSSGLDQPTYVVIGPAGHVLVGDKGQNSVLEFVQDGSLVRTISDADLQDPEGLAIDSRGALYVSSAANDRVLIFNSSGNKIGEITNALLRQPKGLAFGSNGDLFVASFGTNAILQFDPATGDLLNSFADAGLAGPEGLAFTDDGFLFVAGSLSNNIMLIDILASQPSLVPFSTAAQLNGPVGLFAYSDSEKEPSDRGPSTHYGLQKLLVANHLDQQVLSIGGEGDLLETVATSGQPVGVTADFQLVLCDVNHNGKIDSADIALIQAALGQQVAPGDPRDPDADGIITSNDVQICQSFCGPSAVCPAP